MMHCPNIMVRLQLQAKKTDRVKAAEASIKVLLDKPTKETAALIKEAQAEYDGMYSDSYLSAVTSWSSFDHLLESFSAYWALVLILISFSSVTPRR